jgi:hypothetical protein
MRLGKIVCILEQVSHALTQIINVMTLYLKISTTRIMQSYHYSPFVELLPIHNYLSPKYITNKC